ncbi:type II secretion system F family protein [Candidatus Parcubacteria bacterium]|nr:type II secretion system F family protein [Candidatus Parcubacteria bacterium]
MPQYSYTAKSFRGEMKSGTMEAPDKHNLAIALRRQGYILISADSEAKKKDSWTSDIMGSIFGVSLKDKMFFTKNLQVMIGAGIPLPRAVDTLIYQTKSKRFKNSLAEVKEDITKGESFSDSLSKHPGIFSELFVSMIKVGEEAGTMDNVLENLALQMEREHELKSKILGAMMYPAVIVSAMLGIGALMLVVVVPQLSKTFVELNIELPATTRFVIALGNFLSQKWYLVILIVLFLFFLLRAVRKTTPGKRIFDGLFLKLPVISPIIKKINSAYTTRTLGSLISSGVPIVRSLEIVSQVLGNIYFKEAISQAAEKVRKGGKLSDALKPYENIYPFTVIQMIEVGEETGQTSDILSKLADFYEAEVTQTTENLSSIIEPLLMLLIGAAVGFFAISMIQPMYSMVGSM